MKGFIKKFWPAMIVLALGFITLFSGIFIPESILVDMFTYNKIGMGSGLMKVLVETFSAKTLVYVSALILFIFGIYSARSCALDE